MSRPIAVCIEDLRQLRFVLCVALADDELRRLLVTAAGEIRLQTETEPGFQLVSVDDRLVLMRQEPIPDLLLGRGGRSLLVAPRQPWVVLDQDKVVLGSLSFRLHVHGPAENMEPPRQVSSPPWNGVAPSSLPVRATPPRPVAQQRPPGRPPQEVHRPILEPPLVLVVDDGTRVRRVEVNAETFLIGRARENHLTIANPAISRRHCVIRHADGEYVVEDLGSSTGVQCDGVEIGDQPRHVQDGTRVMLGPVLIRCEIDR